MNFTDLNLDLQAVAKRTYMNLLYRSTFMNFLNSSFMEVARSTGTPIIEIPLENDTPLNKRTTSEIKTAVTNTLATYNSKKVDLTELAMDYSFRISPIITTSKVENVLQGQMDKKDSQIAKEIDKYGYAKLNTAITGKADGSQAYSLGQVVEFAPEKKEDYISIVNNLKADLFDRDIYDGYLMGLSSKAYADYVSAFTQIIKYESRTGVESIDRGIVAQALGVDTFEINSTVLPEKVKGYFGSEIATVGDTYFSAMAQYPGNYPGFPGYFCLEGNILFGADVVRPEALIKLIDKVVAEDTSKNQDSQSSQAGE